VIPRPIERVSPFDSFLAISRQAPWAGQTLKHKEHGADPAIECAIEQSKYILELGDNWDGEGSRGYAFETWRRATEFLRDFALGAAAGGHSLEAPTIGHAHDGSIDLLWRTKTYRLLINVPAGDGFIATFYGDDYGDESIEGRFSLSKPNAGLTMLASLHSIASPIE
jgi:hypothetical protein